MLDGQERPRAVSEYLVERMVLGGATKLCFVISPAKADILQYYGSRLWGADIAYVVQPAPGGLCDAVFRARPLIGRDEEVLIGLPDTIWSPVVCAVLSSRWHAFVAAVSGRPAGTFRRSSHGRELTGAGDPGQQPGATSGWIWGVIKMSGIVFHALHELWMRPGRR